MEKTIIETVNKVDLIAQLRSLSTKEKGQIANRLATSYMDDLASQGHINPEFGITLKNPNGKYPLLEVYKYQRPNLGATVYVFGTDADGDIVLLLLPAASGSPYTVVPPEGYMKVARADYTLPNQNYDLTIEDTAFDKVIEKAGAMDNLKLYCICGGIDAQLINIVGHEKNPEQNSMHMASAIYVMDFTNHNLPEVTNGKWYKIRDMLSNDYRQILYKGEILFDDNWLPEYVESHVSLIPQAVRKVYENKCACISTYITLKGAEHSVYLLNDYKEYEGNYLGKEGHIQADKVLKAASKLHNIISRQFFPGGV